MADPAAGPSNADAGAGAAAPVAALAMVAALAVVIGVVIWRTRHVPVPPPAPRPPVPQPVAGVDPTVPAFALTDHRGDPITKTGPQLGGKVWVVCFIFTRCGTICPMVTQTVIELQGKIDAPDVRFIAVSVDPVHDTPEVLRNYARDYGADDRWHFLTGDKAAVYELVEQGFLLAVDEATDPSVPVADKFVHSDRLAIVGRGGTVRKYVRSREREQVATVPAYVAELLAESAK